MSYSSEVLADSPLGYWTLGDSLVSPTGLLASSAAVAEANAVDGDPTRQWSAASGVTAATFRVQFPSSTILTKYAIRRFDLASTRDPKDWTFEGSNNGSSWTTLDTRTGITWPTAGQTQTFTFSNSTAYTYYRLNISAVQTGGDRANLADFTLVFVGDSSGNSREVGAFGGLTFGATGPVSGTTACTFDGSTGYLYKTFESWMNVSAITVEAWVKTSNTSSVQTIVSHDLDPTRSFQFRLNAGKLEYLTIGGGAGTVTAQYATGIANGAWRHVAATYDASNIKLYVDGSLVVTQAASGALPNDTTGSLLIGCLNRSGVANQFQGSIGHVAYYGTALTSTRIAAHAAATGPSTLSGDASLTASSTLTAGALRTAIASATLTATCSLTADGFVGVPAVSGSANLTASSTLTVTALADRAAAAALTATSTLTSAGQVTLQQASVSMSASSVLTATASGTVVQAATAALYAASALFAEAGGSTAAAAALTASSTLTVAATAFTPWVEPNDPRTGKPQYRLIIAGRDGTRNGEITNATTSPIEDGVGVGASFGFTMPTADPKMTLINPPATQAQVWRGTGGGPNGTPEFRGPIVTGVDDPKGSTTFQCRDPFWYLESGRRVIGSIPKRDLLVNGSFASGESPWTGGFEPDSIPAAQPARSVVDVDFFGTRMKALQISGVDKVVTVTQEVKTEAVFVPNSATYLPGGESAIKAVAQKMPKTGTLQVRVEGYTADNRINGDPGDGMVLSKNRAIAAANTIKSVRPNAVTTTVGYGYYKQIPGGQAANRRVIISWNGVQEASGHKQYEAQTLTVSQPVAKKARLPMTFVMWVYISKFIGPEKDGRGLYIQIVNPAKPKVIVDSASFDINEETPRNRWIRMKVSLQKGIPNDGVNYEVQARLYPPAGTALFTRGALYPGDELGFFDVDQAQIIQGLVQHAQDTTIGKGNLGIGTRCQPTGFTRTREYPYSQRMQIDTAIKEISALHNGPEVVMEVTATAQTVVTYHPRQGVDTSEVLVHGGSALAYEAPTNLRDAASVIIMQADGSDDEREEAYAVDSMALDGLMLEDVISTEGETPVTELSEGAQSALASLKHPQPAVWVTVDPRRTGAVMAAIRQGDRLRYVNDVAGMDGRFRFVKRRLSFNDVLEMMLTPED